MKLYVYSKTKYVRDEDGYDNYIEVPVLRFEEVKLEDHELIGCIEIGV